MENETGKTLPDEAEAQQAISGEGHTEEKQPRRKDGVLRKLRRAWRDTPTRQLARHRVQCKICRHRQRAEIEREFLRWTPAAELVREFHLGSERAVYRHAEAMGLDTLRRRNRIGVLDKLMERAGEASPSGGAVVSAVRLSANLEREEEQRRIEEDERRIEEEERQREWEKQELENEQWRQKIRREEAELEARRASLAAERPALPPGSTLAEVVKDLRAREETEQETEMEEEEAGGAAQGEQKAVLPPEMTPGTKEFARAMIGDRGPYNVLDQQGPGVAQPRTPKKPYRRFARWHRERYRG